MTRIALLTGLAALLCSACIPAAAPPVRLAGGGGFVAIDDDATDTSKTVGSGRVHIGLHPLRFFPKLHEREFDVSLGYAGSFMSDYGPHNAFYVEAFYYPWMYLTEPEKTVWGVPKEEQTRGLLRLEVGAFGKAVGPALTDEWGYGGGVEVRMSWSDFVHGVSDNWDIYGAAWGEGGLGVGMLFEVYTVDQATFALLSVGLHFDLPAFIGVINLAR